MLSRRTVSGAISGASIQVREYKLLESLVGVAGFEPATPSSRTRCSTRLSHTPIYYIDFAVVYSIYSAKPTAEPQPRFLWPCGSGCPRRLI